MDLGLKLKFAVPPEHKTAIQFYRFLSKSHLFIIFMEAKVQDMKTRATCGGSCDGLQYIKAYSD